MDTILPLQTKNFSGNPEKLAKVPGAEEGTKKSFTLTIPWSLASLVKNYPGIIVRQHRPDRKRMGLQRAVRRIREGNTCGTVAIWFWWKMVDWFFGMMLFLPAKHTRPPGRREKHLMKDDSEIHLQAPLFRLVQWLSIIRFLRMTSQGSTNLVRKFYLEYALDMHCLRRDFGKETFW